MLLRALSASIHMLHMHNPHTAQMQDEIVRHSIPYHCIQTALTWDMAIPACCQATNLGLGFCRRPGVSELQRQLQQLSGHGVEGMAPGGGRLCGHQSLQQSGIHTFIRKQSSSCLMIMEEVLVAGPATGNRSHVISMFHFNLL